MRFLSIVTVVALLACGCSAAIHHGLDEAAANELVTALERGGIPASKSRGEDGAYTVSVASADAVGAIELLRSLGLPRGRRPGLSEIFKSQSLLPTPTEERARYVEALAGEVARTLETIDGVALARVHLVLPETDPLAMDGKPLVAAQAAVLLKLQPDRRTPIAEAEVQKLVAGSVPALAPASVSVVFTSAAVTPPGPLAALVTLGPLRMTPQSRTILLVGGAAGLILIAGLAVLVLLLARKLAVAQRGR
jgi:type III secretion protein J